MPSLNAAQFWTDQVAAHPNRRFLYFEGQEWTYGEFDTWSRVLSGELIELGIGRRTHVAIVLANSAAYLRLLLALTHLGAVSVPVNCAGSAGDIDFVLQHCDADWVVTDAGRIEDIRASPAQAKGGSFVLATDGLTDIRATGMPARSAGGQPPAADDPWSIVYTSGSTGRPRGVVVPQRAFGVTGAAIAGHFGYRGDDTVLCVLPLYHLSATLMGWAPAVAAGASFAMSTKFSRSRFWTLVDAAHATVTITVPTVVEMVMTNEPAPTDTAHPLRLLVTHRYYPRFAERFGVEGRCLWGMTETSGMGIGTRPSGPTPEPDTIGTPYPPDAEIEVLDPADGQPVARGQAGELWFRHPAVMLGYYREEPSPYGTPGRAVRSGDLVTEDEQGSYHYVGRLKNMIKRGGENISAEEVERMILRLPEVVEVLVVSVPDAIYVEELCAVVVPASCADSIVDTVIAWCHRELPDWKVPRYYVVMGEPLPKLGNEKVDYKGTLDALATRSMVDRRQRASTGK